MADDGALGVRHLRGATLSRPSYETVWSTTAVPSAGPAPSGSTKPTRVMIASYSLYIHTYFFVLTNIVDFAACPG